MNTLGTVIAAALVVAAIVAVVLNDRELHTLHTCDLESAAAMTMNPNAVLARLRDLASDAQSGAATLSDVAEFGAAFQDLDGWLRAAGEFPEDWSWTATGRPTAAA